MWNRQKATDQRNKENKTKRKTHKEKEAGSVGNNGSKRAVF